MKQTLNEQNSLISQAKTSSHNEMNVTSLSLNDLAR